MSETGREERYVCVCVCVYVYKWWCVLAEEETEWVRPVVKKGMCLCVCVCVCVGVGVGVC